MGFMQDKEVGPTVLVTGGAGFFGRALTKRLLDDGFGVRVLDLAWHPQLDARAELVRGDLCDEAVVHRAVRGCGTVFHVAALINLCGVASAATRRRSHAVNVEGTRAVARACIASGASLVYTSTNNVVVDREIVAGDESAAYATWCVDIYTETKILAERLVLEAARSGALRACALRPGGIWGPGAGGLVVDNVLDAVAKGVLVARIGDGAPSDNTHVDNLAHAQLLAAKALCTHPERVSGQAYFITDDEPMDPLEWFRPLFDELGVKMPTRALPTRLMYALGYVSEWAARLGGWSPVFTRAGVLKATRAHWFRIDKARADLGYEPLVKSDEGLRRCAPEARAYLSAKRSSVALRHRGA
jgi:3beta-hydroxy-delta5-steroid dehydrogenase/steroid delta-isomerase